MLWLAPPLLAVGWLALGGEEQPATESAPALWKRLLAAERTDAHPPVQGLADCRSPSRPEPDGFWVGPRFGSLRLRRPQPECGPLQTRSRYALRTDFTSVAYGDCPSRAPSCALPLEIQSWPACQRYPARFRESPGGPLLAFRRAAVRGAPAAVYDEGTRIEVLTGSLTVVVFARDARAARRAAVSLRSRAAQPAAAREELPPPRQGVLSGRLRCAYADAAGLGPPRNVK